ncbi:MAG: hypothetical protein ABFD97_10395 [Syntrophobacter sp.]
MRKVKMNSTRMLPDVREKTTGKRTIILAGACALALYIFVFGIFLESAMAAITLPLDNKTGLDSGQYTIYALGFSTASKQMLLNNGTFGSIPSGSGTIESYPVGSGMLSQITIDENTPLLGARVYFFIAGASQPAPSLAYSNDGASVTQPGNPPNASYPPYSFFEITQDPSYSTTPVVDVQTVDGFIFPLTITLNNGLQVGQPSPAGAVNRASIFAAYKTFMVAQGAAGQPYKKLRFTDAGSGLLNPFYYLIATDAQGQFQNLTSPLNTTFDNALQKLFSNTNLSLNGVASGGIAADVYTVVSTGPQPYPGSAFSIPALQFRGQTHGRVFNIFNPVGLTVTTNPKINGPITGTINGTSLTFDTPLPKKALKVGMFVNGAGTDSQTQIQSLVVNENGLSGVVLNKNLQQPAPHTQYFFSKVPNLFMTSGAMVFGNYGLFADAAVQFPSDGDSQAVLGNLENQIVSALNRGVANLAPATGPAGRTSNYWYKEAKWYPEGPAQNLFSLFMHTGRIAKTPIFVRPNPATRNARGQLMGQAYGFAYDESPAVLQKIGSQPPVPSKFDPTPAGTTTATITLGPWQ